MANEYYPLLNAICHHFHNVGGCTFCGYNLQKRTEEEKKAERVRVKEIADRVFL